MPTDLLEIEVRDKLSVSRPTVSHFLGKASIPLEFMESERYFLQLVLLSLNYYLILSGLVEAHSFKACIHCTQVPETSFLEQITQLEFKKQVPETFAVYVGGLC